MKSAQSQLKPNIGCVTAELLPMDGDLNGYLSGRSTRTFHTPPSYGAVHDKRKGDDKGRPPSTQNCLTSLMFHPSHTPAALKLCQFPPLRPGFSLPSVCPFYAFQPVRNLHLRIISGLFTDIKEERERR